MESVDGSREHQGQETKAQALAGSGPLMKTALKRATENAISATPDFLKARIGAITRFLQAVSAPCSKAA
jgi:hypothetical protein